LQNPRTQRALNRKPGEKGFSLIELVVVIAVLAVLIVIALPNFQGVTDDAAASAGKKWLVDAYTECTIARTRGQAATTNVTAPGINGGAFSNTAAVQCPVAAGTSQTFTPALTTIPTFTIDYYSGAKTCALRGNAAGSYNCTAAGKW
jgi:prepilin-type N-terminal cleavage/methylation domain-containing protein